ncbi:MAG: flippase-like domain-containing protein [Candidatus Altiarchaeota archaeon]
MKKRGFVGLFSIGLLLILTVFVWVGPGQVVDSLRLLSLRYVVLFFGIQVLMMVLWALKWWVVLSPQRVPFSKVLPASFVGYLFNCLTPANMAGGEPARAYVLSKIDKISAERSAASVLVDLFLEILVIFLFVVITLFIALTYDLPSILYAVMLLVALFMLGLFFLFSYLPVNESFSRSMFHKIISFASHFPFIRGHAMEASSRIDKIVDNFMDALKINLDNPKLLGAGFLISIFIWAISIYRSYLIFLMLGVEISPAILIIVRVVVAAISLFSVIPGATGIFEGSSTWLFHLFSIDARTALAATLIDRLFSFWLGMALGVAASLYLGTNHIIKRYIDSGSQKGF